MKQTLSLAVLALLGSAQCGPVKTTTTTTYTNPYYPVGHQTTTISSNGHSTTVSHPAAHIVPIVPIAPVVPIVPVAYVPYVWFDKNGKRHEEKRAKKDNGPAKAPAQLVHKDAKKPQPAPAKPT